ncbi:MAG: AarF/ABC1/UbiB kinase family protein [Actinobacteria bacterium]|nr:AarF/ABC1/UbiB kinase family protein [Actinomycetota bacterium]
MQDTSETAAPAGRGVVRVARLAGMTATMMVRAGYGRVRIARGADRAKVRDHISRENAQTMRDTLGSLKGGAQKAGQLLSTLDSLLPAGEWREAVDSLQSEGKPVGFHAMEPVLVDSLGEAWRTRLVEFQERPVAAASLGQVYRARWAPTGAEVAVKVQYPGVDSAVRADLTGLTWALRFAALVSPGMAAAPVARELRDRVEAELDYLLEADSQRTFAEVFRDDDDIAVPDVVFATPRVLVTEWLEGIPLADYARTGSQSGRDSVGTRFQRFALSAPARAGLLHADPHPGNFRVLPDDRLGVLDFGAVVPMPGGLPETFGHLIAAMRSDDPEVVLARLRKAGLVRPGVQLDTEALMDFLGPFSDPARHETFSFSPEWLKAQFAREHDPRNPDYAVALQLTLPAEQLMTHRVWLGVVGVLSRLSATVAVGPELRRWLPGIDDSSSEVE